MEYTIRNLPRALDEALRAKAEKEGRSVEEVAMEALASAMGLGEGLVRRRDLSDIANTWIQDPEVEAALRDQDRIDPEMWR